MVASFFETRQSLSTDSGELQSYEDATASRDIDRKLPSFDAVD